MQFSIVIPAHRAARWLPATLSSVARQSCPDWELIVVEDGIHDDTAAIVQSFGGRVVQPVRLIRHKSSQGVSHARNVLMREARGGFIAFLDADDLWAADHLATAATCFAAGADVAFSGVTFIDASGQVLPGTAEPSAADLANIAPVMFRYNFIQCTSTLSLRRSWVARVGGFDPALSHGEDLDLWLRLLAAGAEWRYTGRTSCAYRKHAQSAMGQTRLATARLTAFYEKQLGNALIPRDQRRSALIDNLRVNARFSWRDDPRSAAASFHRIVQLQPWNPTALAGWFFTAARSLLSRHA
jgi:glycosyltransferase involved in cell wall biosynthesis